MIDFLLKLSQCNICIVDADFFRNGTFRSLIMGVRRKTNQGILHTIVVCSNLVISEVGCQNSNSSRYIVLRTSESNASRSLPGSFAVLPLQPKSLVTVERLRWRVRRCSDGAGHSNKLYVGEVGFLKPIHVESWLWLTFRVSLRSMTGEGLRRTCILGLV